LIGEYNWKDWRSGNKAIQFEHMLTVHTKATQLTYAWWFCHGTNK